MLQYCSTYLTRSMRRLVRIPDPGSIATNIFRCSFRCFNVNEEDMISRATISARYLPASASVAKVELSDSASEAFSSESRSSESLSESSEVSAADRDAASPGQVLAVEKCLKQGLRLML